MSEEFNNRHINDLSITLKPDDQKNILVSELSFTDIRTKEITHLTFTYDLNKRNLN
jgi:hypothetical protein